MSIKSKKKQIKELGYNSKSVLINIKIDNVIDYLFYNNLDGRKKFSKKDVLDVAKKIIAVELRQAKDILDNNMDDILEYLNK